MLRKFDISSTKIKKEMKMIKSNFFWWKQWKAAKKYTKTVNSIFYTELTHWPVMKNGLNFRVADRVCSLGQGIVDMLTKLNKNSFFYGIFYCRFWVLFWHRCRSLPFVWPAGYWPLDWSILGIFWGYLGFIGFYPKS